MLARVVAVALAVDIILTCLAGCTPALSSVFPLGGSALAQLGLVLGVAVAINHLVDALFAPGKSSEADNPKDKAGDHPGKPRVDTPDRSTKPQDA
jgi:hypothetical protein